jgi:hypothetical protein
VLFVGGVVVGVSGLLSLFSLEEGVDYILRGSSFLGFVVVVRATAL